MSRRPWFVIEEEDRVRWATEDAFWNIISVSYDEQEETRLVIIANAAMLPA
jgi:hypothetical protein